MEQSKVENIQKASCLNRFFQKIKVDSFKLRIPTEKVTIVSTTFCEKFKKLYIDTGEIDKDVSLEKYKTNIENGISTRIGIVNFRVNRDESKEFIYFQLNSKMCKERYLEGITTDTIKIVYDYIIALNIVYVDYQEFINGFVSDIDFAYDINITAPVMVEMNKQIYSRVRDDKFKYVDKPFGKQDNVGMQFNRREKATPSSPFVKIYHKGLEMKHNSPEFYAAYLSGIDLSNHGRLEYTLKNAKHQKHLGISIKTLNQLMEIDRMLIENIVLSGIPEGYIEKRVVVKDYSKITPTERVILHLMTELVNRGGDKQIIYSVLRTFDSTSSTDRKNMSRAKKIIDDLVFMMDTGTKKTMKLNRKVNDVLRILRFDLL
jgi:hypothetical protein